MFTSQRPGRRRLPGVRRRFRCGRSGDRDLRRTRTRRRDKIDWTHRRGRGAASASCALGIEIASSPLATLNDLGPGAVISDFGNNWGVVVGAAVATGAGIYEVTAQTLHRRRVRRPRQSRSLRQGAARRARFHAWAKLRDAVVRCAPAQCISTGMITGVHDIRPGQRSRHVFQGLGEVGCRAVRATPHPSIHSKRA